MLLNDKCEQTDLCNADFCLCILKALLNDVEKCSWWYHRAIDVGLAYVTLNAKCVRGMSEACTVQHRNCNKILKEQQYNTAYITVYCHQKIGLILFTTVASELYQTAVCNTV